MPDSNARFLPNRPDPVGELLRDLQEGLRYVYREQEHVFSWRTTYLDLDRLPFVHRAPHDRFGWAVCRFDVPLRLGALEIDGLQVNVPDHQHSPAWRFDVPPHNLPFEIRLDQNNPENYWQVKDYLRAGLGEPATCWERKDQLHSEWNADGLQLGLTYWFKSEISKTESGFASLNITHYRAFPEYFTDAYTQAFIPDAPELLLRTFTVPYASIPDFYRTSQWVRFTPPAIRELLKKEQADLAVWYDPVHRKLGFAKDSQFCKIVELFDNQQYILELIDHDRGHYSHEIQITRPDGIKETVVSAGVGALEEVVKMLEQAGLRVEWKG